MKAQPRRRPGAPAIHTAIACLRRLADAFDQRREKLAASVNLTSHQWGVLEEIATRHFMPSMFARRRLSTAAAISKTLRQLQDRGLVTATVARGDGRRRAYALTARGRRTMSELRARRQAAIDQIWVTLPAAELKTFSAFSTRLADRLERYSDRAGGRRN